MITKIIKFDKENLQKITDFVVTLKLKANTVQFEIPFPNLAESRKTYDSFEEIHTKIKT